MHCFFALLFLVAAIKWGDWRNWKVYYPTILFFICGDLLKNSLLHDHRMWTYHELIFENIFFGHLIINLLVLAIIYPSTILIYLGRYPLKRWKQIYWTGFWIFVYMTYEVVYLQLHLIKYHYGWTIWWSLVFNVVTFILLRVHHKNPIVAWVASLIFIVFLWNAFNLPAALLK
jgi:hypothetical protein